MARRVCVDAKGEPLPGSPFKCAVSPARPVAAKCMLYGAALTHAIAGAQEHFSISFRDALEQLCHAEELDVYVESMPSDSAAAAAAAAGSREPAGAPAEEATEGPCSHQPTAVAGEAPAVDGVGSGRAMAVVADTYDSTHDLLGSEPSWAAEPWAGARGAAPVSTAAVPVVTPLEAMGTCELPVAGVGSPTRSPTRSPMESGAGMAVELTMKAGRGDAADAPVSPRTSVRPKRARRIGATKHKEPPAANALATAGARTHERVRRLGLIKQLDVQRAVGQSQPLALNRHACVLVVGANPLVVSRAQQPDSERLGCLPPGHLLRILAQTTIPAGAHATGGDDSHGELGGGDVVRACICLHHASRDVHGVIQQQQHQPGDSPLEKCPCTVPKESWRTLYAQKPSWWTPEWREQMEFIGLLERTEESSRAGSGATPSFAPCSPPLGHAASSRPAASHQPLRPLSRRAARAGQQHSHGASSSRDSHRPATSRATAARRAGPGHYKERQAAREPMLAALAEDDADLQPEYATVGHAASSSMPDPTSSSPALASEDPSTTAPAATPPIGWVTLSIGDEHLAMPHTDSKPSPLRLEGYVRQQQRARWSQRVALDSDREMQQHSPLQPARSHARNASPTSPQKSSAMLPPWGSPPSPPSMHSHASPSPTRSPSPSRARATLADHDPIALQRSRLAHTLERTSFAYGGVEPGRLHAHWKPAEEHKVYYSIGTPGRYLLHVRLRRDGAAANLPGSPFELCVSPSPSDPLTKTD